MGSPEPTAASVSGLRKWPVFGPLLDRQSLLWAHSARSLTHSWRWRSFMHS